MASVFSNFIQVLIPKKDIQYVDKIYINAKEIESFYGTLDSNGKHIATRIKMKSGETHLITESVDWLITALLDHEA